ncbi:hypothetical protein ACH4VX_11195 [Streptomyces sp. NPDC020731]|uniref:hypothetical protein n=1 Tax=Streptomyces sp. NPDC020731 TaxID=3365085 RepID=UPI00379F7A78
MFPVPGRFRAGRPGPGTTGPESVRRFCTRLFDGADLDGMATMDGGFPHEVPAHWLPYFAVEDVDDAAVTTTTVEGTVPMEPVPHPEGPRIAVFRDPRGDVRRAADGR